MAGTVNNDYGTKRSSEKSFEFSSGKISQSGEALTEWRLSNQVDNGTSSSSPPYWDTDEENNSGLNPSMLYGRHTWKIEKFSQTRRRELKSEIFDVGGYKWYILIYPEGCDACNHLSLFLCVANHDKLRPGWSHYAQFTIAVVNQDPKKSKYTDTLHRFWKKEHDWGWKKFMEQSKVQDGFIVADTLEIRAQVQIIREKANRPFRCLDKQYRRELLRVYLANVERTCFGLIEERRKRLRELIEDKVKWLSFCTFWIGIDKSTKCTMSRENTDVIMRVAVKQLFIEKEVSSTLVMDTLNSGLKALEAESNSKQEKSHLLESGETSLYISVEDDMFALTDDVLLLLERASLEPLKEDGCQQNLKKEGICGDDLKKDSSEQLEKRLTYLGRKTLETFVFAHIFSNKIDSAYQEDVAFKRQEELIREEEEAGLAELELKEKRRLAIKEKRSNRKMIKQNRNNRKGKDRGKDEKFNIAEEAKLQSRLINDRIEETKSMELTQSIPEKDFDFDAVSDVTDIHDDLCEPALLELEDRHTSCVIWNADTSGVPLSMEVCGRSSVPFRNGNVARSSSSTDDISSTCSTDSAPSLVTNGPCKKSSYVNYKTQNSSSSQRSLEAHEKMGRSNNTVSNVAMVARNGDATFKKTKSDEPVWKVVSSSKGRIQKAEPQLTKKGATISSQHTVKDQAFWHRPAKQIPTAALGSTGDTHRHSTPNARSKPLTNGSFASVSVKEDSVSKIHQTVVEATRKMELPETLAIVRSVVTKDVSPRPVGMPVENPTSEVQHVRPTSYYNAHDTPCKVADTAETTPSLSMSSNSTERRDSGPLSAILSSGSGIHQSYGGTGTASNLSDHMPIALHPSSYIVSPSMYSSPPASNDEMSSNSTEQRDSGPLSAILSSGSGIHQSYGGTGSASNLSDHMPGALHPSSSVVGPSLYSSPPASTHLVQKPTVTNHSLGMPGFTFGSVSPEVLHNQPLIETSQRSSSATSTSASLAMVNGPSSIDSLQVADGFATSVLSHQVQSTSMSEFPHLDIINFLFDDELGDNIRVNGRTCLAGSRNNFYSDLYRQFAFPNDMSMWVEMGRVTNEHFEQPVVYYDDETQSVYGASTDYTNLGDFPMYGGLQTERRVQNQLPIGYSHNGSLVGDGYPIYMQEYQNLACGVGAYGSFQPSPRH